MDETRPLTELERDELVAYLDNEADPGTTDRLEAVLARSPDARREKELLEKSWDLLEALDRPPASPGFRERTATLAATTIYKSSPRGLIAAAWVATAAAGFAVGWFFIGAIPDPNRELLQRLSLIERLPQYQAGLSIDFADRIFRDRQIRDALAAPAPPSGGTGS